jgi:hypothetical protein
MDGPDDSRERAGARVAGAGVGSIGKCAWVLADPVCRFLIFAFTLDLCLVLREKRQMRRTWDEEWGAFGKEGNIWWLGSRTKGWVDVMGTNRWGWICECFSTFFFFP